ncbi:hypothetical protein ONZ51_g10297 [Trametes cubensis]|uniref:HNH nuclease domain-containing protein n=1 Tax=Trametes cubensis TaxID=1111947 RepID=A0AAD7TK25_9APHY|nr:hypothetical protein ONZ51_g10297 [Trametes cubensis]
MTRAVRTRAEAPLGPEPSALRASQPPCVGRTSQARRRVEPPEDRVHNFACLRSIRLAAICVCAAECAAESAQQNGDGAAMPAEELEDAERLAGALERLASTWVSYMLWPFAAQDGSGQEFDEISSSGYATPTPADVVSRLDDVLSRHLSERLREDVLRRDKYTCVYTGLGDADYSEIDGTLEVAHIFKRAVARSDDGKYARIATFDILKHYCELDDSLLEELSQEVDQPHNAILLKHDVHDAFNQLYWCLKPTETPQRYQFDFMPGFVWTKPVDTHHTFYNHSASTELHHDAQSTSAPDPPPLDDSPSPSSGKRDREEH